jgi:hypothetical protein
MALLLILFGLAAAISFWAYDFGQSLTKFHSVADREQLATLKEQIEQLQAERDQYSASATGAESQINIERSAQKQLVIQVKALETENTKLKEDLAFFESLLPTDTGPPGITIRRLKGDVPVPNQLHYQLLVMQGGKGTLDFVGNVQLAVTIVQAGKTSVVSFPDAKGTDADKFKVNFKHYQRVEGIVNLPEGASVKSVEARILERGRIRAQQSAVL